MATETTAKIPLLLHIVASGARRGGEIFASDLVRALADYPVEQAVAILHGPAPDHVDKNVQTALLSTNGFAARFDVRILRALRRLVRDLQPAVIQAHGGEPLKYAALAGLREPLVYRRIGAAVSEVRGGVRRMLFRAELGRCSKIVAVADAVAQETTDVFRVPADRIVTIPNAIDSNRVRPRRGGMALRRSLGLNAGHKVITFLGAFTWEKDPVAAVDVAASVLEKVPSAMMVLAGDGPLRHQVEAAVRRTRQGERFYVLGSRSDVGDILAATDVLLSTSRTEGMPANLIEAGIIGVPVVAYALSGIPEIVRHTETGILVPPGETRDLSKALLRLLEDEAARRSMGRAARDGGGSEFDIKTVASRYYDLYVEVARAQSEQVVR